MQLRLTGGAPRGVFVLSEVQKMKDPVTSWKGGSFASVQSVSMEKGLEKMPAVLPPGAMDCSLWRRAPSPSPRT